MLLERRITPRYVVDTPTPITLDSVVKATIVNASEEGLAIETSYKPVLNSVVRIRLQLPDNDSPCDTSAQVVRSAPSGQIGLKVLKPDSFRTHFETWRRFSTEALDTAYLPAQQQPHSITEDIAEPSLNLEELRAAILQDAEASHLSIFSWTGIIVGVIACALLAATLWGWYSRRHEDDAKMQVSSSPSADLATAASSTPQNLTQSTSESASHPAVADGIILPSTLKVAAQGDSSASVAIPKAPAPQHPSRARIVVGLNRFTRENPKRLHNPDRIYFDLSPGTLSNPNRLRKNSF